MLTAATYGAESNAIMLVPRKRVFLTLVLISLLIGVTVVANCYVYVVKPISYSLLLKQRFHALTTDTTNGEITKSSENEGGLGQLSTAEDPTGTFEPTNTFAVSKLHSSFPKSGPVTARNFQYVDGKGDRTTGGWNNFELTSPHEIPDGCDFPKLDPFDPSIVKFIRKEPPLRCTVVQEPLFYFHNQHYKWNETAFQSYDAAIGGIKSHPITCRHRSNTHKPHGREATLGKWVTLEYPNEFRAEADATTIQCSINGFATVFFEQEYLHVVPRNFTKGRTEGTRYNVMMVMLDAVSRSNFIRQLPLTYKHLTEDLRAVEFQRHVKVGENTEPNIFGLLTGVPPEKYSEAGAPNNRGPFDEWPLLFYQLEKMGYVTSMIEDWDVGSLFVQYGLLGFMKQPLTHYPRQFWLRAYRGELMKNSSQFCYNERSFHNISLNYGIELWKSYPTNPKFYLCMLEHLTHDRLNTGSRADGDYLHFLEQLEPYLEDTFLVVFSDHGIRYHPIRYTPVGRYESSLPALFIVPPYKLRRNRPDLVQVLRQNSDIGLTTVYDMHQTIKHIAHNFSDYDRNVTIGQSLFVPLQAKRTCADAGIPREFCVCQKAQAVSVESSWVRPAAQAIIERANAILESYPDCAYLTLLNVSTALVKVQHSENVTGLVPGKHFTSAVISLTVLPSYGMLEADVRYSGTNNGFVVDGTIARINRYGDQPHCVTDDLARKYCYCKDILS